MAVVAPRRGTPRDELLPTHGHVVAQLAHKLGRPLMPWQRHVADVALEYDPHTGDMAHGLVVLLVPRQAGKTTLLGPLMHYFALRRRQARVWFTAQTGKDASDWMKNEHFPTLEPFEKMIHVRRSGGQESVEWNHNHSIVRMFAPQRDALHGKQSDFVALDEAWAHDAIRGDELLQAIEPTQATRPGAQTWIMSAAGDESSTFLVEQLRRARHALDAHNHSPVLIEYGVPDDLDEIPDDVDTVAAHHPAVGITIRREHLVTARSTLGPEGFARAYGCYQAMPEPDAPAMFTAEQWAACARFDELAPDDVVGAFGVDVAHDRSGAVIVAGMRSGVLEVVDDRPGTEWVAGRLMELSARWRAPMVVDNYGPTVTVADAVRAARRERDMLNPSTRDVTAAAAMFYDDVLAGKLRYRPHVALDDAVQHATTRRVGDAWTWQRRDRRTAGGPITALVAGTLAYWGALQPDRAPRAY